jgi:putative phosphoesterase
MRVAVVSDFHGNLTAFEAVLADVRSVSPDLILHGGDIAHGGSAPVQVVDWIRDLGWPGVAGNVDEMLWRPEALPAALLSTVGELASAEREILGAERLAWLRGLPAAYEIDGMTLVHASPLDLWRAPAPEATDAELASVYEGPGRQVVVYGHIHRPFIRRLTSGTTVVNAGSAGLPFDGHRQASWVLLEDMQPQIRRVEYDVDREINSLRNRDLPCADWVARMLLSAKPERP